ncbi:NAD(P)/FAD-dependent oxidoreductase [Thiomicrospira microaerophila]|uniref:NAD(P)/FAD-dependent oxidoreductase n=1 Tax=Thiomicrospira microaerophila TaxID=406020 RepID=UPI0005C998EA|nr:NAD(P)/FAD-dependent oxidoreductase [Thiomicrospira microaerophila]
MKNVFSKLTRRQMIQLAAAGIAAPAALALTGCSTTGRKGAGNVVVIGGGFGGSAAAKYLKRYNPELNVTLIEPNKEYITCPGSNWVIGGFHEMKQITHNYNAAKKNGINVMHETVASVDPDKQVIKLASGKTMAYDKLVVSPGIDFKWDVHAGVDENTEKFLPHAYKAGDQTLLLRDQLQSMRQGGTFAMVAPPNPFRCPPGPYERVGMVAHYLKQNNPTAKILILDQKNAFSKQGLFVEGWELNYGQMIEHVKLDDGGKLRSIDVKNKTIDADYGKVKADVINYIPPQKAGKLAVATGLTNESGYCPINQQTFESTIHKNIHVIGDACIAGPMPKSGHSATSQARSCAANIVLAMAGQEPISAKNVNTCYSLVTPDYAISVAAIYDFQDGKIVSVPGSGGVSPMGAAPDVRKMEAIYTQGWYNSIADEVWG